MFLSLRIDGARRYSKLQLKRDFTALWSWLHSTRRIRPQKNAALADAVFLKRFDFVELLVENGADISAVPLADVLLTWEPRLMRFFLGRGADPVKDFAFATAFGAKVRTAIRTFIDYKQAHPELTTALQEQANMALRCFCSKGDIKWISLLLCGGCGYPLTGAELRRKGRK